MELFEGIKSQYIDNYGKCRALNFENFSLITSPLPPFDIVESNNIIYCDPQTAKKVIKEKKLEILFQQKYAYNEISGFWVYVNQKIQQFMVNIFLPTEIMNYVENIPYAPSRLYEPINRNELSSLDRNNEALKISIFLKEYTLFTYSLDPEIFSVNSFIIIPNYKYNLDAIGKRIFINKNNVMYKDNKLIVPSEEIRDKLIQHLEITKLNDRYLVENYKYRNIISDYYHSLKDFRSKELQLIFLDTPSIFNWREKHFAKKYNTIKFELDLESEDPYYYINENISESLLLIQNVENGDLYRALSVCKEWNDNRTNTKGYNAEPIQDKNIEYKVYYTSGLAKIVGNDEDVKLSVLELRNDFFCAILPLYEV